MIKWTNRKKQRVLIWVSLVMIWLSPRIADAADYYVDTQSLGGPCSDANPGTSLAAPWCSMERATDWRGTASSGIVAGDTVNVRAGTYAVKRSRGTTDNSFPALNPSNSGTAGNPVTFKNYNGESVILTYSGAETFHGPIIGSNSKNYIVWDGFIIQEVAANNASDTGPVVIDSADYVTIQNCDIRGVPVSLQDNHNGIRLDFTNFAVIRNNKIHGVGNAFPYNFAEIMMYDADDTMVEHNEIYDAYTGVFPKGGDHISGGDPSNDRVTIRYNLIHNVSTGVRVSFTRDTKIYQNIIRDVTWGLDFGESCFNLTCSNSSGMDITTPANIDFYNNTVYSTGRGLYFPQPQIDRTFQGGNDFRNNIISTATYAMTTETTVLSKFSVNSNNYYSFTSFRIGGADDTFDQWKVATGYDTTSITSNPLFVNASNHDFHLQSGSPAINAGTDLLDINGNGNKTEAINLGAYVTGTEIIGLLPGAATFDSTAPRAPTFLTVR